jgi:hypothetical protein
MDRESLIEMMAKTIFYPCIALITWGIYRVFFLPDESTDEDE